ncbi:MAG: RNA-binding protein [Bacteroidota bacterium]|nr:RNA-binding protein [Bacteroidota bacterium]MDP4192300.1 RNA-binding protein [Bacteroidota bacterium]MDP4196432.1 RNA-binding protein [Bacteroidota bacterium]
MSTKLFVGSLPWSINDQALEEAFQKFGTVVSAKVVMDRATGRSKGFGFVEMGDPSEAEEAMKSLNNSNLNGRNIVVNEAKPRS